MKRIFFTLVVSFFSVFGLGHANTVPSSSVGRSDVTGYRGKGKEREKGNENQKPTLRRP